MKKDDDNFLKHAGIYLLARGLPGLFAFLAIPLFTRLLDPVGYGKFAIVVSSVNLFSALCFQGLQLAMVRYHAAYKDDVDPLKSTLLTLSLLLLAGCGLIMLTVCAVPAVRPWRSVALACWVVLAVQQPFDLFSEQLRAQLQPWRFMAMQVVRAAISTLLGAALIAAGFGWWGALSGTVIGLAAPAAVAYVSAWRRVKLGVHWATLRRVLNYGVPLSLTVALAVIIASCDRFLIAGLLGQDAAGRYSVAVDFTARTLTMMLMVVYTAMFPLAVRAWEERGPEAAAERMRHNAAALLAIGVPSVAAMATLAGNIAHCFIGQNFRDTAADIIPLVAFGYFLAGLKAYHWDAAFQFAHRTIVQIWIVLVAAVLNIGLNLLAIPRWGINGAAGASVTAYLVSIVLTIAVGRRYLAIPFPIRSFLQIAFATTLMVASLWPLRAQRGAEVMSVEVAVGAGVYAFTLLALDFFGVRTTWLRRLRVRRLERTMIASTEVRSTIAIAARAMEGAS